MRERQPFDPRTRLAGLVGISLSLSVAETEFVVWPALLVCIAIGLHWPAFRRGQAVISITIAIIGLLSVMVFVLNPAQSPARLLWDFARWASLVAITVTLTLTFDVLGFIAALRFCRVPTPIAMAFGVGLRFLPVIAEEFRRILQIQRRVGLVFSRSVVRRHGFIGLLERKVSPFFASVFRRIDSLTVSVGVQELEHRLNYVEPSGFGLSDALAITLIVLLCVYAAGSRWM